MFVNPGFTDHIVGVSPVESAKIFDLFFGHLSSPWYTARFRWGATSVAVWDNRSTAHHGRPQDLRHLDVTRALHRVTVVGDRPVGPDGFVSQIIAGEEFKTGANVNVSRGIGGPPGRWAAAPRNPGGCFVRRGRVATL